MEASTTESLQRAQHQTAYFETGSDAHFRHKNRFTSIEECFPPVLMCSFGFLVSERNAAHDWICQREDLNERTAPVTVCSFETLQHIVVNTFKAMKIPICQISCYYLFCQGLKISVMLVLFCRRHDCFTFYLLD